MTLLSNDPNHLASGHIQRKGHFYKYGSGQKLEETSLVQIGDAPGGECRGIIFIRKRRRAALWNAARFCRRGCGGGRIRNPLSMEYLYMIDLQNIVDILSCLNGGPSGTNCENRSWRLVFISLMTKGKTDDVPRNGMARHAVQIPNLLDMLREERKEYVCLVPTDCSGVLFFWDACAGAGRTRSRTGRLYV